MLTSEWLAASARYNRWMNDKLYALAANLRDEERKRDLGAFFKSIHGTFNHLLLADKVWLARFRGDAAPSGFMAPGIRSLDQQLHEDFAALRHDRTQTDEALSGWISQVTPEQLAAPLVFVRAGKRQNPPLWWAVAHLLNHQTHHRGQITTLFSQLGHDPGVTDLYAMLREQPR